jgi:hypothetical protein
MNLKYTTIYFLLYFLLTNRILIPNVLKWYDIVPEPTNNFTYLIFRSHYHHGVTGVLKETVPSTFVLEENIMTTPWYMLLPKFVAYTEAIKQKIDQMLSNGMIEKWYADRWKIERDKKRCIEEVEPQILSVDDLRLDFLVF